VWHQGIRKGGPVLGDRHGSVTNLSRASFLEVIVNMGMRSQRRVYTLMMRPRFRRIGRSTSIAPPMNVRNPQNIEIGDDVTILEHSSLNVHDLRSDGKPTLTIGDGVKIGRFVHINAWQDVVIEPYVLITHRVLIGDETHVFLNREVPIMSQGGAFGGAVLLKSGCWIGTGAAIMPGVTVGRNAVIGANAVVTHDIPDFCVAAGVPARVIRRVSDSPSAEEPG